MCELNKDSDYLKRRTALKVKDLMEKLKEVDPEKEIYVRYYRGDRDCCATLEDYWL